ncbi:hypothetical protein [Cohnella fermenti]|uniref:hypothetical protein n=1 Tax=Cohnella fermenti TaxID=2565925 RepID=UPI0038B2D171
MSPHFIGRTSLELLYVQYSRMEASAESVWRSFAIGEVRNRITNIMQKLNVKGRSQAVVVLIKLGELKI